MDIDTFMQSPPMTMDQVEKEILPAETSKFVTLDAGGNINSAKNVISVIPDAPVLGYEPPESKRTIYPIGLSHGTGSIQLQTIDPTLIPNGNIYQIHFKDSRTNGIDDDGDWNINIDDIGEDNCPDAYELGNGDCNSSETGLIDANNDNWNDCGSDGICDENELGYDLINNPDPNNDNYDYYLNPNGTELNGLYDYGELTEGNNAPDKGEPNVDDNDSDEIVRNTSHVTILETTNGSIDTIMHWTGDFNTDKIRI